MPAPQRCDGCSVELLPDSQFCHACGQQVAGGTRGPATAQGERKPLTVLFVETFGSIGLGQRLDAEQWHDLVEHFFAVVQAGVRRFGGHVDRLTGEGIKVLFGAPTALESHARQACHAALHLAAELSRFGDEFRARAGVDFSVRMGLGSGEAVFGPVGGPAGGGFTFQGHTAALAARMLELAAPGRIFLTEGTARLVADFFELAEVGSLPIRGAREDMLVYELVRAREHRSRLDVARERGLTRFIGRTAEMAALEGALRLAQESGHRVVGVVGEPGIGKSRLCDEFAERQRVRGFTVHSVRCVEHGRWMPFHATVAFVRDELEYDDAQPVPEQRDRIARRLRALDPSLDDTLPTVYGTLGIAAPEDRPAVAEAPMRDLARVVRRLVEARARQRVSVIVIDDQQWMDPGSGAIFDALIAEPPQAPVLVVVSYRRGHQRDWMHDPDFFSQLALRPLDREATLELVLELLGDDASLGDVARRIAERAAGNPFFVEEIVRSLVESRAVEGRPGAYRLAGGGGEVAVPTSPHAVLAARIDQLGADEKKALQAAAVIGREFSVPLLAPLTGYDVPRLASILHDLEAADFVSCLGWGDRLDYVFRHPLLCETAYRSLLSERRADLHRRLARKLSELHGKEGGRTAQLALHYEAAGDLLDAAAWHRRAAADTEQWDPVQALAHWRRVRSCTEGNREEPARRLRLVACEAIVRLGVHQRLTADEAEALIDEGRALAAELDAPPSTALLLSAQGALLGAKGDGEGSLACSTEALRIARRVGNPELVRLCGTRLALSHRRTGNLRAALAAADAALATPDSDPLPSASRVSIHRAGLARIAALIDLGRLSTAESELHRVTNELRREGPSMPLAWALTLASRLVRFSGSAAPSLVGNVEEGYALAQRLAVPSLLARARTSLALTRLFQDAPEEARTLAREAASGIAGAGSAFYADIDPVLVVAYAEGQLRARDAARDAARRALRDAIEHGFVPGQIDALLCLGRFLVGPHEPAALEEGRRLLVHGLALVRRTGARSREPHLWLELARHARFTGDAALCRAHQRRTVRLLLAMDALGHLRRAARVLGAADGRAGTVLLEPRRGATSAS